MVRAIRDSQEHPVGMDELLPGDGVYEGYVTESYGLSGDDVEDGSNYEKGLAAHD